MPDKDDFPKDASSFDAPNFVDQNGDGRVTWLEYQTATRKAKDALGGAGSVLSDSSSRALSIVKKYADDIESFFSNPRKAIIGTVLKWFVTGVLTMYAVMADGLLSAWGALSQIPGVLSVPVQQVLWVVSGLVTWGIQTYFSVWLSFANAAGPASPVVLVAMGGVTWLLVTGGLRLAASYVPGGGRAVGILTLRWI